MFRNRRLLHRAPAALLRLVHGGSGGRWRTILLAPGWLLLLLHLGLEHLLQGGAAVQSHALYRTASYMYICE